MKCLFRKTSLLPLLFLAACASGPKYLVKDFRPPSKVAVLPFSNLTNDVGGPETVRKLLIELLPSRGYLPLDGETVDNVLREEFGITEGGQLGSVSKEDLGKALGVDGLFYGDLLTFIDIPLGFARRRSVKANLKLFRTDSGELLWEDEKGWTNPEIHLSVKEARDAVIRQVAERQIEKMRGTFLKEESLVMLRLALKNLPLAR
ncbi:MAG: hypothetical protein A2902_07605 [Elusimicrobia bacterium RIFCSPLOWO2_01_FULL_64_13]|nr:MAG: hypothetical protein A2636_00150 [Elusimicrobia bacterium RIFCSPHIGHO2_01_FULL_64_10]OGR94498.1 MAG: hypothetical protein A2902_07605 [Elusimicrobia bacterium RIFCSPLOWO2_01_FULL_64_13]